MTERTAPSPRSGTIVYQTTILEAGDGAPDTLERAMLRRNLATRRTVSFDGRHARIDEHNADYGVRSPCIRLHLAERRATLYAKALHRVRLCLELPPAPALGGHGEPAELAPEAGELIIAGLRCRRARYLDGARRLAIAYSDEVALDDPTGAVVRFDGVPGVVLAWEELPRGGAASWRTRVEVSELSLAPPATARFALPEGYRRFASIAAARAEDRAVLEAEARAAPGGPAPFLGRWRWDRGEAEVEIIADGAQLRFRTSSPAGVTEETAFVVGRLLAVEEPPNLRLYGLDEGDPRLTLLDDDTFRFHRA
jgi:hypothetical protein